MKRLVVGAVIAAIATISYVATSADAAGRPPGVAAKDWISVSESVGIVLVASESPTVARADSSGKTQMASGGLPLLLKPPVGGYFMIKGASGWSRLVVIEPVKGPADAG